MAGAGLLSVLTVLYGLGGHAAAATSPPSTHIPSGVAELDKAACAGSGRAERCFAVGWRNHPDGAVVLVSGGSRSRWSARKVPSGVAALYGVTCVSSRRCLAVGELFGGEGAAIETSDGGRSWSRNQLPSGVPSLRRIACVGRTCLAVGPKGGQSVVVSNDGGASWSVKSLPPVTSCVAQGGFCTSYLAEDVTVADGHDAFVAGGLQCGGPQVTECPGAIWKTGDGGATFVPPTEVALPCLAAPPTRTARLCELRGHNAEVLLRGSGGNAALNGGV